MKFVLYEYFKYKYGNEPSNVDGTTEWAGVRNSLKPNNKILKLRNEIIENLNVFKN